MRYDNKTTDQLVEAILTHTGLPIPFYDYEEEKWIGSTPRNVPGKWSEMVGVTNEELSDGFRSACLGIMWWYEEEFGEIKEDYLSVFGDIREKLNAKDKRILSKCQIAIPKSAPVGSFVLVDDAYSSYSKTVSISYDTLLSDIKNVPETNMLRIRGFGELGYKKLMKLIDETK